MNLTVQLLRSPSSCTALSESEWDLLVRQARSAELLAHLYVRLEEEQFLDSIPARVLDHLRSDALLADKQREAARWEVLQICRALEDLGVPIILLKGAAYVHTDLPPARGRFFSDIDILVPRSVIKDAEQRLHRWGWITSHHSDYDQRYYRQWMHEIPPLQHVGRQSTIDVHHSILPLTARLHPNPEKLISDSTQISDNPELYTLNPQDMVLHSATHLFHDGELEHGLRDLVDLDRLLRHFSQGVDFWQSLMERSLEQDLSLPLFYALRYTQEILKTPVPDEIRRCKALHRPTAAMIPVMDQLFQRALMPAHRSSSDWMTGSARWLLYIRSHYLRMPLHLLLPHLLHKSLITPYEEWKEAKEKSQGTKRDGHEKQAEIDIFK